MGWPQQRFKGRGAAGGGRRPTSFFLGFGCPREFWYKLSQSRGGNIDNDDIHTRENNVIGEGVYIDPPHVLKLSGGGYIDNDDIRTWENYIIGGEGVYRPPLVLKLSGEGYIDDDRPDKT